MEIGQLASHAGVAFDLVRYYERRGLLPAPPRLESGNRSYGNDDIRQLRFIRRAKALGFSLAEIRELHCLGSADERAAVFPDIGGMDRPAPIPRSRSSRPRSSMPRPGCSTRRLGGARFRCAATSGPGCRRSSRAGSRPGRSRRRRHRAIPAGRTAALRPAGPRPCGRACPTRNSDCGSGTRSLASLRLTPVTPGRGSSTGPWSSLGSRAKAMRTGCGSQVSGSGSERQEPVFPFVRLDAPKKGPLKLTVPAVGP